MKYTHKIHIPVLVGGAVTEAESAMRSIVKLLRNSGHNIVHAYVESVDNVQSILKPPAKSIGVTHTEEVPDGTEPPTPRRLYIHTEGESLFYGLTPFTGKLDKMKRIQPSGLHPHYSNPNLIAQDLREVLSALGIEVLNS